ncbi:amylo-alpha-1,6-glucosidase [Nannocystis sp. SCPEA4]|uniref:amylo-alpha-1,6-glucosidase n=1 Tax=Nannocystis sp. SCPEA4 TaxID=2996787 RepID=UPI002270F69D|nr:amylo-alpha-1,6-glucosidase [Nannocystis sp. SCPEA4]MCY1059043.1 amylo-alpha-1,6-glucosidase [Nannocystis sp. SCPEA4]
MSESTGQDRYKVRGTKSRTKDRQILKQGDTFAVFDCSGELRSRGPGSALGLYHHGTRFLSQLCLRLAGRPPLVLGSRIRADRALLEVDLANAESSGGSDALAHATAHVLQTMLLWSAVCHERLRIANYSVQRLSMDLEIAFAADFADLFEVRGTKRERHGMHHEPEVRKDAVVLSYTGLDGERRETRLGFAPPPDRCGAHHATYQLELEPGQTTELNVTIACHEERDRKCVPMGFDAAHEAASRALDRLVSAECAVTSSNRRVAEWLRRSFIDLRMMITETDQGPLPYAGVPWYSAPFGRDAIITALEALWVQPELARGVLRFLAATQADTVDAEADAEPGKIVHEVRRGEMAKLGEVPFGRYYGTVDATPLFIVLAARYLEHTGDIATIRALWPNIERALEWIERYGDCDGDGFVEYERRAGAGLDNQGWKDSQDAIFHADGSLARGPIALCEVQSYVYAALRGAARVASRLERDALAQRLLGRAEQLRERFDAAFWCEDLGFYALALDGLKRQCRVRTSNAGQCLFGGIVRPERVRPLVDQLFADEMFSGWGIRTVATSEVRYNPMSYHNGSVWPHDNALIAWGLARYGLTSAAQRLMRALFHVTHYTDLHRLPELFCGFQRRPSEGPTKYPVACSPQSWATASPFLLLEAALGMQVEGAAERVSFSRPVLPRFVRWLSLRNLRVGASSLDLMFRRHREDVGLGLVERRGRAEVLVVK